MAQYHNLMRSQDPDLDHTQWFWIVGVVATMIGATLTAVGLLIQKRSHLRQRHTPPGNGDSKSALPYWLERQWLVGGAIWVVGNLICWGAAGLAPQSLLSCFDCWNILAALAVGYWCFGERVNIRTGVACSQLVLGCVWVVIYGPKRYHAETAELFFKACGSVSTVALIGVTAGFLIGMGIIAFRRRNETPAPLTCLQFAAISATLAWYASVLSRSAAALLVTSVEHPRASFHGGLVIGLLCGCLVFAVFQIHFLNLGLKLGDGVVVLPAFLALSMAGQIVVGGLFFDEFHGQALADHLRFWPGVLCVVLGVASLTQSGSDSFNEDRHKNDAAERTPIKACKHWHSFKESVYAPTH